ncbi:DUF2931 family protein [Flavobacterium oreochromis]|uniref:DUF2931 family protein n=2 Tax=Flavobacterium oreochromis TaxID=2906078 RepID=UPI00385A08B0
MQTPLIKERYRIKHMKKRIIFMAFLMMSLLSSCQNMNEKKFEWLPTESSPALYPMRIYKGYLIFKDSTSIYIPCSSTSHTGWGNSGSMHVVGEDFKPVPVKLEVTWASFLEKKFYTGSWDLPYDKMLKLFEEGYINYDIKKRETYNEIIVGLAPGGAVSVWIGGSKSTIEIAHFRAQPTTVSMKDMIPGNPEITEEEFFNRFNPNDAYDKKIIDNFNKNGIPFGIWSTAYREKYHWKIDIALENKASQLIYKQANLLNGEIEILVEDLLKNDKEKPRGLPRVFHLEWLTPDKKAKAVDIEVNEPQLFEVIKKIDKNVAFQFLFKHTAQKTGLYILQRDQEYLVQTIAPTEVYDKRL